MKIPRKPLAMIGAIALVSIGSAAYASSPWTVSVGGSSTGSAASFTASTVEINPTTGDDPDIEFALPGTGFTCATGAAAGTITPGATANKAGEITGSTFNTCPFVLGLLLDVTQTSVWDINILSDNVGGVTPVESQ